MRTHQGRRGRQMLLCAMLVAPALGHDPGLSGLQVRLAPAGVEAEMAFAAADFAAGPGRALDRDHDGVVTTAELEGATLPPLARSWCRVEVGGQRVEWTHVAARVDADGGVAIEFAGSRQAGDAIAVATAALGDLPHGHRQFAVVTEGDATLGEVLLSAAAPTARWALAPAGAASPRSILGGIATLIPTGVEHVVTGYDHLLFLLGLLLTVASWRQAFAVVSAFTVAHSLTLAAAAFEILVLPGVLVECAIAASVAFVGAENLLRRKAKARVGLTFAFGLVHGLGFAGCLQDLGVARGADVLAPLLGFNLGVELGQLALVGLALPLLLWLRRRSTAKADRLATALSLLVLACGVLWLLERLP